MKFRGSSFYIRKTHRYLGIFIGVQFLMWTTGGLYFSWTDIDEIHGDHLRAGAVPSVQTDAAAISPADAVSRNAPECAGSDVSKLRIVSVLGESFYALPCRKQSGTKPLLLRTTDGGRRPEINEADAKAIATAALVPQAEFRSSELLTEATVGKHHEYRTKPLPAWAVTFASPQGGLTAYVAAEDGQVHAVRTGNWRMFDFLWMLHTMDFAGRDNFNNYLLRGFSALGVLTVLSGFVLYFTSSKMVRRLFRRRRP